MNYKGEHSITFYRVSDPEKVVNTWTDWQLIPVSRPTINPPSVQNFYLTIPGRSGKIDFTDSILPSPAYDNREGSLDFIVDHDSKDYIRWIITYNKISEFLHGQKLRMILSDEPDVYYEGRFSINEFKSNSDWSSIVIDYDVLPYKMSVVSSLDNWLWNPFNFITGYIRKPEDYKIKINGNQGPVMHTIINIPGESIVTIEINPKVLSVVYVFNKLGSMQTYRLSEDTDYKLTFTIYPERPNFYIQALSDFDIEVYINFTGGRL